MTDETTASPPADIPVVETEQQATTQEITQEAQGEQPTEQVSEGAEGEEQPERKRLSGAQKAKRRETYLLNQLAQRESELEALRQNRKPESDQSDEKAPKEEDFNGDWTAYVAARAAYEAGKAVEGKLSAREARAAKVDADKAVRERDMAHIERVEDAREIIADYDKVMAGMKGVTVSDDVIREIKSSEKGAFIAYELARDPDRLHAMSRMTPMELAREMGRLESSVKVPAGKKQTTAPPPPTVLRGGAAAAVDLGKADMAAYVAERKRQGFATRN